MTVVVDHTATAGQEYYYRLEGRTATGSLATFGPVAATAGEPFNRFSLAAVRPNPAVGVMAFGFTVPYEARVRLSVLDMAGREVTTLAEGTYPSGRHEVSWNGQQAGRLVPPGLYFACYQAPELKVVRRVVVTR
jgi:hypothetical protein